MFGIILTSRGSPATRSRRDRDRVIAFPPSQTASPQYLDEPTPRSPRVRRTAGMPLRGLRICEPESGTARETRRGRARRILGTALNYIAHPSFDDPSAHDAILAPGPEAVDVQAPRRLRPVMDRDSDVGGLRDAPLLSREQEVHLFRKMNYLKCLAGRIRDRIDPHRPAAADLDEIERLQNEALKLKNWIIEANLGLVVSIANKRLRPGRDLSDRVSDGSSALMRAVDRFDFARGNRFSTYATWAIINELTRYDRRERRRRNRSIELYWYSFAAPDSASVEQEHKEAHNRRLAVVGRWLDRLNKRERRILASRYGIGGAPEQTLQQIGRDLGICKERVRQIVARSHAKLRGFARLEALEPSEL
jgi:RNA polymerase primary sigma factor